MEITAQETSALYVSVHRERVAPTRLRANGHAQDHHPRHCHNVPRGRFRGYRLGSHAPWPDRWNHFCATGGSSPYHRQPDGQSSPRHLTVFWPAPEIGAGPELPPNSIAAWPGRFFLRRPNKNPVGLWRRSQQGIGLPPSLTVPTHRGDRPHRKNPGENNKGKPSWSAPRLSQ